ncbi:class I SAM-dependent methyltransferase [Pleurocapsa sp. PCC 7319]|uniref:class I SAM-dependent methyltransferase n=1 Tax=Pleurocapsa sp. PCC 7319 TaxID=118161 RepID=UPI000344F416|nr:class I SAM-dependent methyltransferase [Pleurocapsa sp. PCC 7319]
MKKNINVTELQEVSETLLLTVYLRNLETLRKNRIIKDYKSVEIVNSINYNFSQRNSQYASKLNQAVISIRTEIIDEFVKKFINQHPHATIVNLGTGLCTRFFRIDNGSINWFGIDLPRVKPVWNKLIGESERYHYLAYSILDFDWIEKIRETASEKILFIAEGILMYFTETEVKQLMSAVKDNFPDSELIFDSLGVFLVNNSQINSCVSKINVSYKWGIENLKEIETWDQGIKLANQWYCFDRHKCRLGWIGLLSYIPMLRRQIKIGHIQFT